MAQSVNNRTSRILIDLPISVHKILKIDAIGKGTNVKNDIEKLAIDKANRLSAKQTELFNQSKAKDNAKDNTK
jgi:hypothetical protein